MNKPYQTAHTPRSSKGIGEYTGRGIRAPLGRMRGDSMGMMQVTPKGLKTAPKTLA